MEFVVITVIRIKRNMEKEVIERIENLEVSMRQHQHTTIDSTSPLPVTQKYIQSFGDLPTITPRTGPTGGDLYINIPAIAQAFTIANVEGTPVDFQKLIFRIKDDGTGRAITWGAEYVAGGVALPTTTTAGKILHLGFMYDTANALNAWLLIAKSEQI